MEEAQIVGIVEAAALAPELTTVDVGGRLITPGLIDIHTHGAVGHSFNEPTAEAWTAILEINTRRGVTSVLATVATASLPLLCQCLQFSALWMSAPRRGPGNRAS